MKPGLDDLGDPAVDDRARVDDDVRVARPAAGGRRSASGRRTRPIASAAMQQVLALGDGQAEHPEPEEERDPERQPGARAARSKFDSGNPSRRPISRPMSSPMTAATNSAVESSSTWRMSQQRGHDRQVRQDREADDDPGDDPGRQEGAGVRHVGEQLAPIDLDGGEREADEAAEGGPKDADVADQRFPRTVAGVPGPRSAPADGQPSIAGTASPRARRAVGQRGLDGVAQRRDRDDLEAVDRRRSAAPRRWPRHDRPPEPEPGGLAQPALEADDGPQLAEQADLADGDRPGRDRPVARRRGEGEGERQVERRLGDRQPAGQVGVDVVAAEGDPGPPAEDRDEQAQPVRVEAARLARRACRSRSG